MAHGPEPQPLPPGLLVHKPTLNLDEALPSTSPCEYQVRQDGDAKNEPMWVQPHGYWHQLEPQWQWGVPMHDRWDVDWVETPWFPSELQDAPPAKKDTSLPKDCSPDASEMCLQNVNIYIYIYMYMHMCPRVEGCIRLHVPGCDE